jgi:probable phosphoglycerate mutase
VLEADDGTVLDARGETIGVATNNVAEYSGLIAGLAAALERGVDEVEVVFWGTCPDCLSNSTSQ